MNVLMELGEGEGEGRNFSRFSRVDAARRKMGGKKKAREKGKRSKSRRRYSPSECE